MSARTDRIEKLTSLIAQAKAVNQSSKAEAFSLKLAKFQEMTDDHYDYLMAMNAAILANPGLTTQAFHASYYAPKGA